MDWGFKKFALQNMGTILLLLLHIHCGTVEQEKEIYAMLVIEKPSGHEISFAPLNDNGYRIFELGSSSQRISCSPPDMIYTLLKLTSYKFSLNNVDYIFYPSNKLIEIKNGMERCLGYYSGMTFRANSLIFKYKNGDISVGNKRYSSRVEVFPGYVASAKRVIKDNAEIYHFRLGMTELMYTETTVSIGCYSTKKIPEEAKPPMISNQESFDSSEQSNQSKMSSNDQKNIFDFKIEDLNTLQDVHDAAPAANAKITSPTNTKADAQEADGKNDEIKQKASKDNGKDNSTKQEDEEDEAVKDNVL